MKMKRFLCAVLSSMFFSPSFSAKTVPESDNETQTSTSSSFLPYIVGSSLVFGIGGLFWLGYNAELGDPAKLTKPIAPKKVLGAHSYLYIARNYMFWFLESYIDNNGAMDPIKINDNMEIIQSHWKLAADMYGSLAKKNGNKEDQQMQSRCMAYARQCDFMRKCLMNSNVQVGQLSNSLKYIFWDWISIDKEIGRKNYIKGKLIELYELLSYFDNSFNIPHHHPLQYWSSMKAAPGIIMSDVMECCIKSKIRFWSFFSMILNSTLNNNSVDLIINDLNSYISVFKTKEAPLTAKETELAVKYIKFIANSPSEQRKIRDSYQGKFLYYFFTLFM